MPCPFCQIPPARIIAQNGHAFAIRDAFPVAPGHTLVIPWRHVGSFFDTTQEEKLALLELVDLVGAGLRTRPDTRADVDNQGTHRGMPLHNTQPAAFNIGINDGPAAGQTVPHLHIHLIPRYEGDAADPRGGVRWVMPEKAKYW